MPALSSQIAASLELRALCGWLLRWPGWGRGHSAALLAGSCGAIFLPWLLPAWLYGLALLAGLGAWRCGSRLPWLGVCLAGFGLAGLHAGAVLGAQLPPRLEAATVALRGRIVDLPRPDARRTRFEFLVDDAPGIDVALRGRRLLLSWYDPYGAREIGPRRHLQAGARWELQARVRAPRGLRNPGGFDGERQAFASRRAAVGYVVAPESARQLAPPRGLQAWRERQSARIAAGMQGPSTRFVRALALGDTRFLDDVDWERLRAAGLTHLIAISGFHVGLVAGFFALVGVAVGQVVPGLGRRLPRPQLAGTLALLGAGGYAMATGLALPTVRTTLMLAVAVLARCSRRPLGVSDALGLALAAILVLDPLAVLAAGFWLSFGGVAWLAWCLPRRGTWPVWREFLSAQGVATVGLLPLTVVLFGQASLAGPLANLLAIPWWSLVVVPLSLLGTGLELVHAGAGQWAWQLAGLCFEPSWQLFTAMAGSRFALFWLPEPAGYALPWALAGAFWCLLPRGLPGKGLAMLLWLPLLWPDTAPPRQGELQLTVIDVGQGLSVLVRTRGHALLYDAGPAVVDGYDAGERAVVPSLRALGVTGLDRLVASHADGDHAGGMDAVRRGVPVAETLAPAGAPLHVDAPCTAGQEWQWDGVRFRILHPGEHFPYLGNEASCVLRIESAHGAVLLTGDIGEIIEGRLVREQAAHLRADVVLVAHHGSAGSSTPGFVRATGARLALVSSGHGNRFGHPRGDVVRRWQQAGAEVLDTSASGAISVWLEQGGPAVRERRAWQPRLWDAARRQRRLATR